MSRNGPVTRETLYEEVWAESMTKFAASFVAGVAIVSKPLGENVLRSNGEVIKIGNRK